MSLEQKREICYSQLDPSKKVSYETILQFFQDIAVTHTNESGFSLEKLAEMKKAWIILSMHAKFLKPISLDSQIKIKTWTYDFSKVFGPRAYQVLDVNTNDTYALASAMWTYIDTESGRPSEIPQEMISYFGNEDAPDISYLRRAPSFSDDKFEYDFRALKRDLDSNGHMNNVRYLGYSLEALPENALISEVEIFYKHPVFLGNKISVYSDSSAENAVQLTFKNQEGTNCAYIKFVLG